MTCRVSYTISPEPTGAACRLLLEAVGSLATEFGVIVRSERVQLSDSASRVLEDLDPYKVSVGETQAWPGSQLVGDRRSVLFRYRSEPGSVAVVIDAARMISDWVNPYLPEDLHFLRGDGSVVMGSIAQENEVWVELSDEETRYLRARLPPDVELRADAS